MHDDLDLNLEPNEPSVPDVDQGGVSLPQGEVDHEGAMAKADLYKLANYSLKLFKKIQDGDQLEGWVQAKITKAADYIASVYHYLEYEMQFSEYGKQLDNSDVLSEGQKAVLKNKLMEAKAKIKELKLTQAEKQFGLEEGILGGGEETCKECGGSGVVMVAPRQVPEELKGKVKAYNRKAKAMAAAVKRVDANKNGIPDDEEMEESAADEPAAPDSEAIAKKKAREAAARRREEKADADLDDLSKDVKPKGEKSSGSKKVAGKAYGGSAQKDEPVDEMYGQGVYEGKSKKAKKDYDKDGKIESEKDEVIGSRRKAAGLDEAKEEKRAPAKKTERETTLPSGAKVKTTKVQGWQSQKADKAADKEKELDESKPSAGMSKKEKSAVVKKAKAGGDIGKPGKGFAKVEKAAKAGGAKDPKAVAAAAMWKQQAKESVKESIERAVSEGMTEQEFMAKLNWLRQNNPGALQAALQSSDPNALNKLVGFTMPKGVKPTPAVSDDDQGTLPMPTKAAQQPAVVRESAELDRMKEFLTRLNG